jgi:hypothetical protein
MEVLPVQGTVLNVFLIALFPVDVNRKMIEGKKIPI